MGVRKANGDLSNLALDKIINICLSDDMEYLDNEKIIPEEYYKDVIGVTVTNLQPMQVKIFIEKISCPLRRNKTAASFPKSVRTPRKWHYYRNQCKTQL